MRPKDALIKDGKIAVKSGRGRMSLAARARCQELVDAGWTIDGFSKSGTVADKPVRITPAKASKPKDTAPGKVIEEYTEYNSFYDCEVVDSEGTVYGMATVCYNKQCPATSATQCVCGNMIVLTNKLTYLPATIRHKRK